MTHDTTSPSAGPSSPWHPVLRACLAVGLVCLTILCLYQTVRIRRQGAQTVRPSSSKPEIHRYSPEDLSALAGYLSDDLDDGRLRVAPPISWYVAPRDKAYLVRFVFDRLRQSPLPRITIEAHDADFQHPRDVTQANLPEFLKQFTDSLDERTRRASEGRILMLMLGDVPCVSYTLNREFRVGTSRYKSEREVLVTLRNGRLYTVSLDVYAGKLLDSQGDAYAVVAGLRFVQPTASDKEQTPPDETNKKTDGESGTTAAGKADSTPDAR